MKTALLGGLVLCAALLSGCGNACDHEKRASDSLADKQKACGSSVTSNFDLQKCQDNLHSCSQDDLQRLDNFSSCIEGIPSCPPGTGSSLAGAELGCLSDLGGISAACLQTQ